MTTITKQVQQIGLHDASCETCAISTKEAEEIMVLVKQKRIKVINEARKAQHIAVFKGETPRNGFDMSIEAVEGIK